MPFTPDADTLYLCDGGAARCGEHLGETARCTGRDVSGHPIGAVSARVARVEAADGHPIRCDVCGKRAFRHVA